MAISNNNNEDAYQLIADSMSDLVCLHDPQGIYLWVSPSARRILGYEPDEMLGKNPYSLFHPDDRERIRSGTHDPALEGAGNIYVRYRMLHRSGFYVWLESLTQPILDDVGTVVNLHTTSRDVTEQVRLERALAQSEALHRSVVNSLAEGVMSFARDGRVLTINEQASKLLELNPDNVLGRQPKDVSWRAVYLDGTEIPQTELPLFVTLSTGQSCRDFRMGLVFDDAKTKWVSVNSEPVTTEGPQADNQAAVVLTMTDISDQLRREAMLEQWSTVFRHSREPILLVDLDGIIQEANPAFGRLLQLDSSSTIGTSWSGFLQPSSGTRVHDGDLLLNAAHQGHWRGELWLRDTEGGIHATWASISALPVEPGTEHKMLVIFSDFQEKHEQEKALRIQATHDALTGLPNRLLLMDRFDMALKSAQRHGETFACFYLDLDDFKPVNDRYGHAVGDEVLKTIARRLKAILRDDDSLARLGGDEFVMLITSLNGRSAAGSVADKVLQVLTEVIPVGGRDIRVNGSLGVGLFPHHAASVDDLLHVADQAMYRAKHSGGSRWLLGGPREGLHNKNERP
ncbi:sensor domain-containing protein [Saccharospirillum salsuginis]|uniref:PAS domain S-box-containing protein/diguanylate cyclase (GGDEF) domain-containing protein n=1 Tax=Saccharospirillum salsuginis TaxID=418750 RepID=A0A918KT34_9GAMM|nr:diguanylate cyclase [Saccharospirillum salsuginis]GGX72783.1 hypothetical protein GCM10007392_45140 [Saccharospirillum salsuginis]